MFYNYAITSTKHLLVQETVNSRHCSFSDIRFLQLPSKLKERPSNNGGNVVHSTTTHAHGNVSFHAILVSVMTAV
jgi:hypothetical protein